MNVNPRAAALLKAGQKLAPLIRENAEYADIHGRLAPEVVAAYHENGLFGMWVPEVLGGAEADPLTALELCELISYEDASAGWVLFTGSVGISTPAFYLPDEGVKDVFSGSRMPVGAGQGTRSGKAVRVEGGYRLTGEWNFASSAPYASHIFTLGTVEDTKEPVLFVLPAEDVNIDTESWDVIGLRGTGSFDYSTDDAFVPDRRTYPAGIDGTPVRGGVLGKLGLVQTSMIGHTAWALGVGRRLLDELSASMREKAGRAGAQAGSDSSHEQYANAEAQVRSARALAFETWSDAWETLSRGGDISKRQSSLMRLALNNATWSAFRVGTFVNTAAGTRALRQGTIQRFYRDLHAGAAHIMSAPPVLRDAGRELAGLAEHEHWFYAGLVGER
ncbi:acyl-CoA dehydrogenase family protein [Amycolatopsis pithecellobii]|uniref:Acyl-CoA dehydrogenase n=1 Tax=Amycolatopsis pithecellobii TaxID=664692 RepID=A0A6N7YZM3_9PSEU|nr:acyl-CoA dehydrogenase family protein [Amycolatopsis pithecellobii]MTD52544.1 acyl-CoA dehydrogenase [Amycolatopsis pithecellobii]